MPGKPPPRGGRTRLSVTRVLLAAVLVATAGITRPAVARGRGLEVGVDGGYELSFSPGTARVTHFHFPFGYLSYEPAMRVGVPFAGRYQLETGLGVDEFTPQDAVPCSHFSHWRGRVCVVRDLAGADAARRGFVRLGPITNIRHYDCRSRLQFGGTVALGLRLPIVTHLGARVEVVYSQLVGTVDLPRENIYALHVGISGFTR